MVNIKCRICDNEDDNTVYEAKEMMLGLRDKFTYFQCSECECLQISEIPENMSRYYPENYYSFHLPTPKSSNKSIKNLITKIRNKSALYNNGVLGKLISKFYPNKMLQLLSRAKLTVNSTILDVGCGNGSLLFILREMGLENLLGVDPYNKEDIEYDNGLKITRKTIHELDNKWDFIMFHHSFEHLADPFETLQSVSRLLNTGGTCLIGVPTVSSYAWEHYRENWVGLDAPRHFFLHSAKSITILAEKLNMVVDNIVYDSTDFQFWGSEQYIRDIPLADARTHSIFSKRDLLVYKQKAKELNLKNQGDTCAFFLRKI